ncbi:MAG: hypoxanthine phosphoribosyltransferase [Muribaculaceae bacterium]
MESVTIKGMNFVPYITKEEIATQVQRVADEIRRDFEESEPPLFICVLNGAFVFAADLFRACRMPESEITFMRYKSYEGTCSSGTVSELLSLSDDITGRHVIIIEDIVDTGVTAEKMIASLKERKPASIKLATLLFKPQSLITSAKPDYVGFEIPSKFIIGYGLDLDGRARDLSDIFILDEDARR